MLQEISLVLAAACFIALPAVGEYVRFFHAGQFAYRIADYFPVLLFFCIVSLAGTVLFAAALRQEGDRRPGEGVMDDAQDSGTPDRSTIPSEIVYYTTIDLWLQTPGRGAPGGRAPEPARKSPTLPHKKAFRRCRPSSEIDICRPGSLPGIEWRHGHNLPRRLINDLLITGI